MPYLQTSAQLKIPFGGRSPRAKAASFSGARAAVTRAGSQRARLLIAYLHYGPSTDLQQAERVGIPESRVSARRSGLLDQQLVTYHDDVPGPHGAKNCRWRLTNAGREVVGELARAV